MDIPASLLAAYRHTDYRVRLAAGGYASIRIDEPLPVALQAQLTDSTPWAFVTACNPFSAPTDRRTNHARQRQLLHALHGLACVQSIHAGCGIGRSGWREPSLFVIGLDTDSLDRLIDRFEQHAAVAGRGHGRARLHWHT